MSLPPFTSTPTVLLCSKMPAPTIEIPETTVSAEEFKSPHPKRCALPGCKKRLTLTDFDCKCGMRYCTSHRYSESHNCAYDYKKDHASHLSTVLVKCVTSKIEYV